MADYVLGLIQAALDRAVERGEVGGANVLVLHHGHERWYAQSGFRSISRAEAMSRDTIVRLYSQTKPITAVAAMILVERGLLDLAEPVSAYLPGFANQRVSTIPSKPLENNVPVENTRHHWLEPGDGETIGEPVQREACIKDLLTMRSGLAYPEPDSESGRLTGELFDEIGARLHGTKPMGTVEIANRLGRLPLAFQPGKRFTYSTSADVLGAVIEVASGRRLGDFLREEIFEPLDMVDTGFFVPEPKLGRLAAIYEHPSDLSNTPATDAAVDEDATAHRSLKEVVTEHLGIPYAAATEPAFQSGGAGLRSTVDDYAHFAQMMLNQGEWKGVRILSPTTVSMMTHNALDSDQLQDLQEWHPGCGYNALMRTVEDPAKAEFITGPGTYGWYGWLGTYWANDPKADSVILFQTQLADTGVIPLTRRLSNIVAAGLCEG